MKKSILVVLVAAGALALTGACGSSGDDGGETVGTAMPGKANCTATAGQGVVCGKVVAADGETPLANAEVRLNESNIGKLLTKGVEDPDNCFADTLGEFACEVPPGVDGATDFIVVFSGYNNKSFTATIAEGSTTDAGTLAMAAAATGGWVVVPGRYDGVQVLLAQLKGCTLNDEYGDPFDPLTGLADEARWSQDCEDKGLLVLDDADPSSDLYVPTFLKSDKFSTSNFSALFNNCDANPLDWSGSDGVNEALQNFAAAGGDIYFSDLADSWLTATFPGYVNFSSDYLSNNTGDIIADVNSAFTGLYDFLGGDGKVALKFDLPEWASIDSVESSVNTYISGDISSNTPYTGIHPITVGWRESSSAGCIVYTSYHIEGASTGSEQEKAIKYIVQNTHAACPTN